MFAILTIVLPVVLMISFGQKADKADQSENPYKGFEVLGLVLVGLFFALIAAGVSSVFGTLTGVVALIRDERSVWRPIVGLIVNAPVTVVISFAVILMLINSG